jgi:hypothetical protein
VPVEELVLRADPDTRVPGASSGDDSVEAAIKREDRLSAQQREALLAVYRGFLGAPTTEA